MLLYFFLGYAFAVFKHWSIWQLILPKSIYARTLNIKTLTTKAKGMTHFNLENELNTILRMDAPITKGPSMRWQKKTESDNNVSVNSSMNVSTSKTPMKNLNRSTSSQPKTPSAGSSGKTPKSGGELDINNTVNKFFFTFYYLTRSEFWNNEPTGFDNIHV